MNFNINGNIFTIQPFTYIDYNVNDDVFLILLLPLFILILPLLSNYFPNIPPVR